MNPWISDKAMEDQELVRHALNNHDQRAYTLLMERYRHSLYATINKMVHHPDDAEDLVAETFAKAFSRLESYNTDYAFSTWIYRIAMNCAIDFLRKKKIELQTIDVSEEEYKSVRENMDNPEEQIIIKERAEKLKELIEKLNPALKQILDLRYFQELSIQEISDKLHIPLPTVKTKLFRARALLLKYLKEKKRS